MNIFTYILLRNLQLPPPQVLPLENKMKYPHHFAGTFGVLNTAMFLVVILYAATGFFGYLRYGSKVLGSITLNLPPSEP